MLISTSAGDTLANLLAKLGQMELAANGNSSERSVTTFSLHSDCFEPTFFFYCRNYKLLLGELACG